MRVYELKARKNTWVRLFLLKFGQFPFHKTSLCVPKTFESMHFENMSLQRYNGNLEHSNIY